MRECDFCGQTLEDGIEHFQETLHNAQSGEWKIVCFETQSCNHEWETEIVNLEGYIRGYQNPITRRVCKHCGTIYKYPASKTS